MRVAFRVALELNRWPVFSDEVEIEAESVDEALLAFAASINAPDDTYMYIYPTDDSDGKAWYRVFPSTQKIMFWE